MNKTSVGMMKRCQYLPGLDLRSRGHESKPEQLRGFDDDRIFLHAVGFEMSNILTPRT